jgi:hypothetical protein
MNTPEKLLALKPLVRKGIPQDIRPDAWYIISGACIRQSTAPVGHYKDLSMANPASDVLYAVEEDIHSTAFPFRGHPLYQSRYGVDALRRLILAYSAHNEGGYFRGLHCIAAFMLIVMGTAKEEEAFWTLTCLLENRVFNYCNGQVSGLPGAFLEVTNASSMDWHRCLAGVQNSSSKFGSRVQDALLQPMIHALT